MYGPDVHPEVREESVALATLRAHVALLLEVNGPNVILEIAASLEPT